MRVFVTGATGWVGSAVVQELIRAGHQVTGLVRSAEGAVELTAAGARPFIGSLDDIERLQEGASEADAVIHTAFNHDWSRFAENSMMERRAIEAMGTTLEGSSRPFLITSGVALLAPGRIATEEDEASVASEHFPRAPEATVSEMIARGVRAIAIRLAPSVHGLGDHGFVPRLAAIAREKGVSAYVGDGLNRWPAVHRLDAARVYRLALEKMTGGPFHAVGETGVALKDIAEAISHSLGLPLVSLAPDEAAAHFGWFAPFASLDAPANSDLTRALLDWAPEQPGLLADLAQPGYFSTGPAAVPHRTLN
ncbi:SDR family oxidoreductase (plasmid) [Rahnella aquatilis]|uniref:SDR family oxidoreductase n=2 Tax=Rahnella perminowiae TaxID=2816244 RepID=A0ABS6KVC2_9GAMM|nr:SDR family oxidoreductase [Rahnella perminowiae]MBU9833556.1 SDR family oxidoreductase [Rahnella perminowiae]UJD92642.1 SDR family oxidoreductase [Rahnella aquatilis]